MQTLLGLYQAYVSDAFFKSKYFYRHPASKDQILKYFLEGCSKLFMSLGIDFPHEVMQGVQYVCYTYDKPPRFNGHLLPFVLCFHWEFLSLGTA